MSYTKRCFALLASSLSANTISILSLQLGRGGLIANFSVILLTSSPRLRLTTGLQPTSSHQSMSDGVILDPEALLYPTANGRSIPATTEKSEEQCCTNTDVDDDGTVVGRVVSRHTARLREILMGISIFVALLGI